MAEIYDRTTTTAGHKPNWSAIGIVIAIAALLALVVAYAIVRGA